jgi:hypothetical protein
MENFSGFSPVEGVRMLRIILISFLTNKTAREIGLFVYREIDKEAAGAVEGR